MSATVDTRRTGGQTCLAAWIERIAHQDERALAALHEAISPDVYKIARRLVWGHAAAEEIVGDCFWQIWTQAKRYAPERGSVMAWIASITRSRAIDLLRRRDAMGHCDRPVHEGLVSAETATSDPRGESAAYSSEAESLETVARDAALRELLNTTAPAHRQMLALAFYAGMSHQEISAHCGLPLGTVKSHLRRGLAALKASCIEAGLGPRRR